MDGRYVIRLLEVSAAYGAELNAYGFVVVTSLLRSGVQVYQPRMH